MFRGFLLDSARCIERRDYYRRAIEFISARGGNVLLWHFTDDQGCMYDFQSIPGIASPHAYSRQEMKDLIHFAADRGIDLIPEVASLGHSLYITRLPAYRHLDENESPYSGMCPTSAETREIIRRLITETAEVFESRYIHAGLDEVYFGRNPLTKEALKHASRGRIFCDHVHFVHDIIKQVGRRMWMWGDGLLANEEVFHHVSRDITICNWQYQPSPSAESTQRLLDAGFDVLNVSALISHHQTLLPGEETALNNVRAMRSYESLTGKGKVLGSIACLWMPTRYLSDAQWLPMHLAAGIMMHGAAHDMAKEIESFLHDFYGLPQQYTTLFHEILKKIPARQEWMQAVKHTTSAPLATDYIHDTADFWRSAVHQLRTLEPHVRHNHTAFRTFMLTIQLLAHAYDALEFRLKKEADSLMDPDIQSLAGLHRRGRQLLEQVQQNWDRERFPDDPCKFVPTLDVFRDEHLTLLLSDGIDALESDLSVGSQPA